MSAKKKQSEFEIRPLRMAPFDTDEVVSDDLRGAHLERMSDTHVWMNLYLADGRTITVNLSTKRTRINVMAEVDHGARPQPKTAARSAK